MKTTLAARRVSADRSNQFADRAMRFVHHALIGAIFLSVPSFAVPLAKTDAGKLALYRANNEKLIVLTVVARKGGNGQLADAVKRFGGRVDYRFDKGDFLTAVVPTDQVLELLSSPAIEAVEVDNLSSEYNGQLAYFSDKDATEGMRGAARSSAKPLQPTDNWPPKLSTHPLDYPHPILQDMDGEAFRQRHPGNDGRGVVIAQVEWFPDLLSPELQIAYDKNGRTIPKILDLINVPTTAVALDPNAPRKGEMWSTRLSKAIRSEGTRLARGGMSYTVPKAGSYRLAQFSIRSEADWTVYVLPLLMKVYHPERVSPDDPEPDPLGVRDENEVKQELVFDVLWSDADDAAWLDTDGDRDFSDEQSVRDYKTSFQIGTLGRDDPSTIVRETVGYAIQKDGDYVGVNVGFGGHASTVAGAAAASRGTAGRIDGVAPGAQLLIVAAGANGTQSTYIRAFVAAFAHPKTDVVLVEGHGQVTGDKHNMRDGRSALALILQRLVEIYDIPTFMTAGNAPGMSTIMDTTIPYNVMSVGAYHSGASIFTNYAVRVKHQDDLHWVGSEGPSGLGALKPDFISPANPMSIQPRFRLVYNRVDGLYEMPPGYAIGGGTSVATPVASGAAALIVGAARREGLPHDANAIHRAFKDSARFLPELPAYKQGRGLIQIDAAWKALQAQHASRAIEKIDVAAPVRTANSHLLPQANTGIGLFEREGWRAGDKAVRTIALTRTSGSRSPLTYDLSWQGGQTAFSTADTVTLPLNQPVELQIAIAPTATGVHSSILHLRRAGLSGPAVSVPVTVVAPVELNAEDKFEFQEDFKLDRPGRRNVFCRVPEATKLFTVVFKTARDKVSMHVYAPDNQLAKWAVVEKGAPNATVAVDAPTPGVWQIVFADSGDALTYDWDVVDEKYLPATAIHLSVSVAGATATVQGETVRLTSTLSAFNGGAMQTALGGLRIEQRRIEPGQMLEYDIDVEAGSSLLVVQIDDIAGARPDIDLHLFDCTKKDKCVTAGRSVSNKGNERAIVSRPAPGKWKAVILATGQGTTALTYADYYTHPRLGALNVTDVLKERNPGDVWDSRLNIWRAGSPKQGYQPIGVIWVREDGKTVDRGNPYGSALGGAVKSYAAPLALEYFKLFGD